MILEDNGVLVDLTYCGDSQIRGNVAEVHIPVLEGVACVSGSCGSGCALAVLNGLSLTQLSSIVILEDNGVLVDLVFSDNSQVAGNVAEVHIPVLEGVALASGIGLYCSLTVLDDLGLAQLYEITLGIIIAKDDLVSLLGHLDHEEVRVVSGIEADLATALAADGSIDIGIGLFGLTVVILGNHGVIAVCIVIHVDAVAVIQAVQRQCITISLKGDGVLVDLGDIVALKESFEIIAELSSELILGHDCACGVESQCSIGISGQGLIQSGNQEILVKVDLQVVAVAELVTVGQLITILKIIQNGIEGNFDFGRAVFAADGDINGLLIIVLLDCNAVALFGVVCGVSCSLGYGGGKLNQNVVLKPAVQRIGLTGDKHLVVSILGNDECLTMLEGHGSRNPVAILVDVSKGHIVSLDTIGNLDLAVLGDREVDDNVAVLVGTYGTLDLGIANLDNVLVAVLDTVHVHADVVAALGCGDINRIAVLILKDDLVDHLAVLLGAGHVEGHFVGVNALFGDLIKNVLDLFLSQFDLNVIAVVEFNADIGGLALFQDGAHGDVDLVVARSVALDDDLVTVAVLIHGHVAALRIFLAVGDVVNCHVGNVAFDSSGNLYEVGAVLKSPACEGVDVSGVLVIGHDRSGDRSTVIKGLSGDHSIIPILEDDGVAIDFILSCYGRIFNNAVECHIPAREGIALAGRSSGSGSSSTCGNVLLHLQHGTVVVNEGNGEELGLIYDQELGVVVGLEGDLATLCAGKDVFTVAQNLELAVGAVIHVSLQRVGGQILHGQDILNTVVGDGLEGNGVLVNGIDLIAVDDGMVSRLDYLAGSSQHDLVEGVLQLGDLGNCGLQSILQSLVLGCLVGEEDVQLVAVNHQGVLQAEAVLQFLQQRREVECATVGSIVNDDLDGILGVVQRQTLVGIVGIFRDIHSIMSSAAGHGSGNVARPGSQEGTDLIQIYVYAGNVGGCFHGVAVLHGSGVGSQVTILITIIEGNGVGLALLDHLDLGVVRSGEGDHVLTDDGVLHLFIFAGHRVLNVYLVLVTLGSLGNVDGHGIAAMALEGNVLTVHTEGQVISVSGIALGRGDGLAGNVQLNVLIGLAVCQESIDLLADGSHFLSGKEYLHVIAVGEIHTDAYIQVFVLEGFLKDGTHGDDYAIISRSIGLQLQGRIGIVGIGRRYDNVAALRITIALAILSHEGVVFNHCQSLIPTCEGVDGGQSLDGGGDHGSFDGSTIVVALTRSVDPLAVLVTVLEVDHIFDLLGVVLCSHDQIRGNHVQLIIDAVPVVDPESKGVTVGLVTPSRGDHGSRGSGIAVLYGNLELMLAVLVLILESNGIFSQLEGNFNGRTAGGLGEGVFGVGDLSHDHGVAVLIGNDDLIDLIHNVARIGGHGDGHGLALGGVLGINGYGTVLGRSDLNGILLGLFDHVDLAVNGSCEFDDGVAVLVGTHGLERNFNQVALSVLYVDNVFLLGIGQSIYVDTNGVAAVAGDDLVLTVNTEGHVILDSGLAAHLGLLAGGVDGNVIVGQALLFQDLIQLGDDVLHLVCGEVDLHEIAVTEVVGILEAQGGILLHLLDHGAQGHVDLRDTLAVGANDVDGDIVVFLVLAKDHVIADGLILVAGGCLKGCLVGSVCVSSLNGRAPGGQSVNVVQVCLLGGSLNGGNVAPSHGGLCVLHAIHDPSDGEVNALAFYGKGEVAVGHGGCLGERHDLIAFGELILDRIQNECIIDLCAVGHVHLNGQNGAVGITSKKRGSAGILQEDLDGQLVTSYAVFICNGSIGADINIRSCGDDLAVVEINKIMAFHLGHVAEKNRKIHAGSHKDILDGAAVIHVVEAVVAHVSVHLDVNVRYVDLGKDLFHQIFKVELAACNEEGIALHQSLADILEVTHVSGGITGEQMVTVVELTHGEVVKSRGDLLQGEIQNFLELLALVHVQLSAGELLNDMIVISVTNDILQLADSHRGVDHVEVIAVSSHKARNEISELLGGCGRLVCLLEDQLELLVGEIEADVNTAVDTLNSHNLFYPLADLYQIGGVALESEGHRPGGFRQTVGRELHLVVTERLVGNTVHRYGRHMGEAVHAVIFVQKEFLDARRRYETADLAIGKLIQHLNQMIQAIVLYLQDMIAVDRDIVDACIDACGSHVVHQILDLSLKLVSVFVVQDIAENVQIIVLGNAQRQHDLMSLLIDHCLEHAVGRGNAIGKIGQFLCQIRNGTRDDGDLLGIGGGHKEGAAIPRNILARNKAHFGLGGIVEHVIMAVGLGHGLTVGLPLHRIGGRFLDLQITLLYLYKVNELVNRGDLSQYVKCSADGDRIVTVGIDAQQIKKDGEILLAVFIDQQLVKLIELFIPLKFICQITLCISLQGLAVQREIVLSFKELLDIPQHIRSHFISACGQHGAEHYKSQHENGHDRGQNFSQACSFLAHNTPPVIKIFSPKHFLLSIEIIIHIISYHETM